MRLIISTDCFLPRWDGVARFLSLLLPEIAPQMQVTVFAPRFEGECSSLDTVRVIRFPLINIRLGDTYYCHPQKASMEEVISETDVVFNQTAGPIAQAAVGIASKHRKPVVSYIHSVEWELAHHGVKYGKWVARSFVRTWIRPLYERSSLLLVPSEEVAVSLHTNGFGTKTQLAPMGVPIKQFSPPASKADAKTRIGIDPRQRVVGFCGRLSREKDFPTLILAFEQIRYKYPDTRLLIVGDGSRRKDIPSSPYILAVGQQDDVVPFLQAMDVFALPSLSETSSLATMEAMSVGLPVVVTPVGHLRQYVSHGQNGLFFTPQDVSSLVENIEFLLNHPTVCQSLGSAARRTIAESYSWENAAHRIKDILMTVARQE